MIDGYETTTQSLSLIVYELAMHPDVQDKLYDEIIEKLDTFVNITIKYIQTETVNFKSDIVFLCRNKCHTKWSKSCPTLNKSFRNRFVYIQFWQGQFPIVPYAARRILDRDFSIMNILLNRIDRECCKDFTFNGHVIKKGTKVNIPVAALHFSDEYYPDAETFNPDRCVIIDSWKPAVVNLICLYELRWSPENKKNMIPYTYLPFGGGPRGCLGTRFAMEQMKITLSVLIPQFEFYPVAETPVYTLYFSLTYKLFNQVFLH